VHGQVGLALALGLLELGREQSLATLLLERPLRLPVPCRHHLQQLRLHAQAVAQHGGDGLGLGKGKRAFAGCDDELRHGGSHCKTATPRREQEI